MKVIEELVNYLKSEGLISDANVDWLRAQGLLPSLTNSSDVSDFDSECFKYHGDDSSESLSDALDDLAEQQTQEGLRRKLSAWKHTRKRTSQKTSGGGSSGRSKPKPQRAQSHHEQRLVSEQIQAVESVSRTAAIKSLVLCLKSVEASFHGALVETLVTIGSQSADAFIGIVLELQENGLLEESASQQIARSILTRSASREQEVLYRTATLYEELYVEQGTLGSDELKWLYHHIFTASQQKRFLEILHASQAQRDLNLLQRWDRYRFLQNHRCASDQDILSKDFFVCDDQGSDFCPGKIYPFLDHNAPMLRELSGEILLDAVLSNVRFRVVDNRDHLFSLLKKQSVPVTFYAISNIDKAGLAPSQKDYRCVLVPVIYIYAWRWYDELKQANPSGTSLMSVMKREIFLTAVKLIGKGKDLFLDFSLLPDNKSIRLLLSTTISKDRRRFTTQSSLSDVAAESLTQNQGGGLFLDSLTSLSDAAAESLAKHKGRLSLNGLTGLSDVAAESLAKHKDILSLDGLTSLSDTAAKSLAKHKGVLSLNGLISLSDPAAKSLAKHKYLLSLDGLTSLSDAAAESLAKHKGRLSLNGLTGLSDVAAESLAKHKGNLSLNGLTSLSDAAWERLVEKNDCHLNSKLLLPPSLLVELRQD